MLSFKTTHAIQILDLLQRNEEGLSVTNIRNHFLFLPNGAIISNIVWQLSVGKLIGSVSAGNSKYRIITNLNDITLEQLVHIVDDTFVMGTPVGFLYWQIDYLNSHPRIAEVEQQLQEQIKSTLRSITVAELLKQQNTRKQENPQKQHKVKQVQTPIQQNTRKQPRTVKQVKTEKQQITTEHATATI